MPVEGGTGRTGSSVTAPVFVGERGGPLGTVWLQVCFDEAHRGTGLAQFTLHRQPPVRPVAGGGTVAPMDLTTVIETRPGVRNGMPCFVGTRIAVYDVLEYLASGMTTAEIVADFPELTPEHVRAAIEFAAQRERRLATA